MTFTLPLYTRIDINKFAHTRTHFLVLVCISSTIYTKTTENNYR